MSNSADSATPADDDIPKRMAKTLAIFGVDRPHASSPLRERLELASLFGQFLARQPIPNDLLRAVLARLAVASDDEVAGLWPAAPSGNIAEPPATH